MLSYYGGISNSDRISTNMNWNFIQKNSVNVCLTLDTAIGISEMNFVSEEAHAILSSTDGRRGCPAFFGLDMISSWGYDQGRCHGVDWSVHVHATFLGSVFIPKQK